MSFQSTELQSLTPAEDEQDQEADGEYTQAGATYAAPQNSYSYNAAPAADVPRVSEMASPQQNGAAGVVTPRTSAASATTWQGGYPTPQRSSTGGAMYPAVVDNRDSTSTPNGAS